MLDPEVITLLSSDEELENEPVEQIEPKEEQPSSSSAISNGCHKVSNSPTSSSSATRDDCLETFSKIKDIIVPLLKTKEELVFKKKLEKAWDRNNYDNFNSLNEKLVKLCAELQSLKLPREKLKIWGIGNNVITTLKGQEEKDEAEKDQEKKEKDLKAKKEKKILHLERKLKEVEDLINEYDETEVDLNDEESKHSAYLIRGRLIERFNRYWQLLCHLSDCNTLTGRSIQKKILPTDIDSSIEDIDIELSRYLNSKGALFCPDYSQIYKVVTEVQREKNIDLVGTTLENFAKKVFQQCMAVLKSRRSKDLLIGVMTRQLTSDPTDDPANHDEELARKLEENKKLARKEEDVIHEFVTQQQSMSLETEVVENQDGDSDESESIGSDDDEEDDTSSSEVTEDATLDEFQEEIEDFTNQEEDVECVELVSESDDENEISASKRVKLDDEQSQSQ